MSPAEATLGSKTVVPRSTGDPIAILTTPIPFAATPLSLQLRPAPRSGTRMEAAATNAHIRLLIPASSQQITPTRPDRRPRRQATTSSPTGPLGLLLLRVGAAGAHDSHGAEGCDLTRLAGEMLGQRVTMCVHGSL
jgi:hypothetical protein